MNIYKLIMQKALINKRELAEALCVSKSTITMWELGKRTPRMSHIRDIVNFAKKHNIEVNLSDFINKSCE